MYRVVRLREDSLQLPRPEPAVQQQARPRRVTTACIHNYGFKQVMSLVFATTARYFARAFEEGGDDAYRTS